MGVQDDKENFQKNFSEAFKRQVVSEYENGDNIDDLQKKYAFTARTRILVAYVLFNTGLFLPVFIFEVSDAVKVQLNLEVAVLFALWAIFGGMWGKRGCDGLRRDLVCFTLSHWFISRMPVHC